jgi:hypothetical protein
MREGWISAALVAGLALVAADPLSAQQGPTSSAQPSIMAPDAPPPPAKPTKHSHANAAAPEMQSNPDLDTDDQLAPSQMKQAMPAAVAEPSGATHKPAHPAMHAATDAPSAPAAPAAKLAAPATSAHVVACSGPFAKDSSHLKLAMTFDSRNITFTDVDANGGSKVPASVLFPNDPKRRLEVWWSNPAARSGTYLIVINGKSTWAAPRSMKLGLTLAQLEKLNQKPFKLKGFDKDGVTTVNDWDGGLLATIPGGCKSGLSLRADPKAAADAVSALAADKEYSSSDAEIRAVKPTVSEILIGY